jgi:Flp pilus assembly protein TadG
MQHYLSMLGFVISERMRRVAAMLAVWSYRRRPASTADMGPGFRRDDERINSARFSAAGLWRNTAGAVAVELAIVAPFLATLGIGIIDFSAYMNNIQAIATATRVGAEFARDSSTCRSNAIGISYATTAPTIGSDCATGIDNAMKNSAIFSPALTTPDSSACGGTASMCLACYCTSTATPNTFAACNVSGGIWQSCYTNPPSGYGGPQRVLITVTAQQSITPLLSWPGFPTRVHGVTQLQIQ